MQGSLLAGAACPGAGLRVAVVVCEAATVEVSDALHADRLWGWPVELLDELSEVRRRAYAGELSLEEWRERDAILREGQPSVDREQVGELQMELIELPASDDSETDAARKVLDARLGSLVARAPSDEQLLERLGFLDEQLANRARGERVFDAVNDRLRATRERIVGWLHRPGGPIDALSDLPWTHVLRYRYVDEPGLGPVPQDIDAARARAYQTAAHEGVQIVTVEPGNRFRGERIGHDYAIEAGHGRLTGFARLVIDAADHDPSLRPLADQLRTIWNDPRVQRLLTEETATGWPAPTTP